MTRQIVWQRVYDNSLSSFWNGFCHLFSGFDEEHSQSLLQALLQSIEIDKGQSFNSDFKELIIQYFEECPTENERKFPYAMLILARRMFTFNEVLLGQIHTYIYLATANNRISRKNEALVAVKQALDIAMLDNYLFPRTQ